MYLVFTRMPGESYQRPLRSLLLYLCCVFRALITSLVCWFCTSTLGLVPFQIFFFFFFFLKYFIVPWGNFGSPYLGQQGCGSRKSSATLSPSACVVFPCVQTVVGQPLLGTVNPFTARMSFQKRPIALRNLKPLRLFVFFFALACERIFLKTHSTESRCVSTGKYTVCRRVLASFSPGILQAGAVKWLTCTQMLTHGTAHGGCRTP